MNDILKRIKSSKLFQGFAITTVGSGISKLILVLATFYCTNMMSKEDFGEFSFIRNTLNTILCVCALNYMGLCTKFAAEALISEKGKKRLYLLFFFSFLLCLAGGVGLLVLPDSLMTKIIGVSGLTSYFRLMGVLFPVFMLQPLIEGVLRGMKKFNQIGKLQIISSLFFFAVVSLGLWLHGVSGAIYGVLCYYLVYSIVCAAVLYKLTGHNLAELFEWKEVRTELEIFPKLIIPVFVMSFVAAPLTWWAQTLLAKYDSLSAVGSMSAVLQIRNIITLIPSYFFSTFMAFAAGYHAEKQYNDYFRQFRRFIFPILLIGVTAAVVLSVFGKPILGLYGKEYMSDIQALVIANLSIPFMLVGNFLKGNLTIREHQRMMLLITVLGSLAFIGTLYVFLNFEIGSVSSYFYAQLVEYVFVFIAVLMVFLRDQKIVKDAQKY